MRDLVEFLGARVAEALDTLEHVIGHLELLPHKPGGISVDGRDVYDVRRVLAECEAKRRIVEECQGEIARRPESPRAKWLAKYTLLLLALPYADHPDYREEWRP